MKTLLVLLSFLIVSVVSAHEIKTVGPYNILLHMEPQDSPVVGDMAELYLSVDDKNNKFRFSDCDCQIVVANASDEVLVSQVLPQAKDFGFNVGLLEFTFPSKGIYTVKFAGNSKTNVFESFAVNYVVRIERENINQAPVDPKVVDQPNNDKFYIIYWSGLILLILFAIIYLIVKRLRKP